MRINQNKADLYLDRAEQSRLGATSGGSSRAENRSQQFGLDHVEVSRNSELAASIVDESLKQRQVRLGELSSQFQAGTYAPNLSQLSQSILDHDTEE